MKITLFNFTYTAIFVGILSFILYTFSDTLVEALNPQQSLGQKESSLENNSTESQTNLKGKTGIESARLTIVNNSYILNEKQLNEPHTTNDDFLYSSEQIMSDFQNPLKLMN